MKKIVALVIVLIMTVTLFTVLSVNAAAASGDEINPGTSDALVVAISALACVALAGVVAVLKKK